MTSLALKRLLSSTCVRHTDCQVLLWHSFYRWSDKTALSNDNALPCPEALENQQSLVRRAEPPPSFAICLFGEISQLRDESQSPELSLPKSQLSFSDTLSELSLIGYSASASGGVMYSAFLPSYRMMHAPRMTGKRSSLALYKSYIRRQTHVKTAPTFILRHPVSNAQVCRQALARFFSWLAKRFL